MSITVPEPLGKWIEQRIESGPYSSASDYVRDLIRQDQEAARLGQLSVEEIRRSIEEQRQESTAPADEVLDRLEQRLRHAGAR